MKLSTKLLLAFLIVGVVPFATIGVISLVKSQEGLKTLAFNQLESVSAQQSGQIQRYFAERQSDMGVLSDMVGTLRQDATDKLSAVRDIKAQQVEAFFDGRIQDAQALGTNPYTREALGELARAYRDNGGSEGQITGQGNFAYTAPLGYEITHDMYYPESVKMVFRPTSPHTSPILSSGIPVSRSATRQFGLC